MQPGRCRIGSEQQLMAALLTLQVQYQSIPARLVDLLHPGASSLFPDFRKHRR